MAQQSAKAQTNLLGWGIDDPVVILGLIAGGISGIAFGFVLAAFLGGLQAETARGALLAGAGLGTFLIGLATFFSLNSSVTKYRQALILASILPLGGAERILDVGCGRGAFSVAAAKQLSSGTVVGVDVWNPWHVTGNSPDSLKANAVVEGVEDRIVAVKAHGTSLPFPDATFDVVASCLGLSHVGSGPDLEASVAQLVRVLKGGGRIAILSAGYGRRFPSLFRSMGLVEIETTKFIAGFFPYAERTTARKPFPRPLSN